MIPTPYNITSITSNSSSLLGMAQGVNTVLLNGGLGILILLIVFCVVFLATLAATFGSGGKALIAASFISFMISILLRTALLVNDLTMWLMLAAAGFSIAFVNGRSQ